MYSFHLLAHFFVRHLNKMHLKMNALYSHRRYLSYLQTLVCRAHLLDIYIFFYSFNLLDVLLHAN